MADETPTRAPAGSKGRPRRRRGEQRVGATMRFRPAIAAALEQRARETGESKIGIVEALLERELGVEA